MKLLLLTIVGAAILAAPRPPLDDETIIYDLALHAVTPLDPKEPPIALADTTQRLSWKETGIFGDPRTRLTYARPETVEAFVQASSQEQSLPKAVKNVKGVRLVNARRLAEVNPVTEREFARINATWGSARVSAIGFNEARTQALLFVAIHGDAGYFIFLEHDTNGWRISKVDAIYQV